MCYPSDSGFAYIVVFVCVCYYRTLDGNFVFDDNFAIVKNPDVTKGFAWNVFQNDFWGMPINNILSNKSYRPLTTLSFTLNFWLANGFKPFYFRLLNVVVHVTVCYTLFLFLRGHGKPCNTTHSMIFFVVLLYGIHPVHTEVVCNAVGRAEMFSLLFLLLSLITVQKIKRTQKVEACSNGSRMCGCRCTSLYMLVVALATLGYLSKESGLLALPISFLYSTLCFEKPIASIMKREFIVYIGPFLLHLALRYYALKGSVSPNFTYVDNPLYFQNSTSERAKLTMLVHWQYMRLLIFPSTLSCDYGPSSLNTTCGVPIFDYRASSSCVQQASVLYGGMFSIALVSLHTFVYQKRDGLQLFSCLWFLISMYPASHLGVKIGTVVAERLLYTPLVPFILWIFSCLVSRLDAGNTESNKVIEKRSQCIQFVRGVRALVWNMIVCVILIFCALRTIRRVDDWHSNETLFQSALTVYPDNARMNNNVGTILLRKSVQSKNKVEVIKSAFEHFQRATKHAPSHAMAWHNCGLSLLMLDNATASLVYFENAIKLEPNVQLMLNNYGIALQKAGKTMEAAAAFKRSESIEKLLLDEKRVKRPGFDQ